jgi:alanine-synthesizing transaminase
MTPDFHRIRRLPPYIFEEVNRLKARLRAQGVDIIDFGMGNPDMPTPPHIVEKLIETVRKPKTNRYSASKGIPGLRRAMAGYYARRFGVKLDPDTEVVATLGSKEGFANLAQALTAPGDVIICPNPAYPIHAYGFIMAEGVIRHVPALTPEQYLSGVSRAVHNSSPPPSVLIVSYPSNPTAQWVDLDFYKDAVALAKKHDMLILSDVAYSEIYFENNPPPSLLQVPGARDIGVEVNSLSKTYAMAGWRVGMVVGNARLCAALARVKSYLDYGAFTPIQVAAAAALNGPQDCVDEIRSIYKRRRDVLVESMQRAGWEIPPPARLDVRLGAAAGGLPRGGLYAVLQAADGGGCSRRRARRRVRRIRRGLCAHRPGRERASDPAGGAQCKEILTTVGADSQPRPRRRTCAGAVGSRCRRALCALGLRAWARSAAAC